MDKTKLIERLEEGLTTTLVIYGTSLSFHLAPLLRATLTERFGEAITVVNSGLSAKASRSGLHELDKRVIKHQPDALLIEFAVNDAYSYEEFPGETLDKGIGLAESRRNLEILITRTQEALPGCEILVQTMNPTYDSAKHGGFAGSRRSQLTAFYQAYRDVALAQGLKLIDNTAMWEALRLNDATRFEELVPDGVHPTPTAIRTVLVPFLLGQLGVEN